MGFYAKHILPRLLDAAMRNKDCAKIRAEVIPQAHGVVLELGIGSGLNLPFYGNDVTRLYAVEPSQELLRIAQPRISEAPFEVDLLKQSAESPLPLPDASVDTAVTTWTLCTIPDAVAALREVHRVLKPGGELIFVEHGRVPDARVAAWQDRLTPLWKRMAGGCHLNRKIDDLIESAGLHTKEMKTFFIPGPRFVAHIYQGRARVK